MTKRDLALQRAKVAGYHGDQQTYVRILVEPRIAQQAVRQAFANGQRMKREGVECSCFNCKRA